MLSAEPASPTACEALHDEIENDFRTSNHCVADSDCKVVRRGGWYVDFDCYKFVNTATDENALLDKIDTYKNRMGCGRKINDCMPAGLPVCVQGKCTGKK